MMVFELVRLQDQITKKSWNWRVIISAVDWIENEEDDIHSEDIDLLEIRVLAKSEDEAIEKAEKFMQQGIEYRAAKLEEIES